MFVGTMAANLTGVELHDSIATEQGKLNAANAMSLCGADEVCARAVTVHLEATFGVDTHLIKYLLYRWLELGEDSGLEDVKDTSIAIRSDCDTA